METMSSHADAIAQNKSLEEFSDENMINYFKTELEGIEKGKKASELLLAGVLKHFREIGVFKQKKRYELTDKTWDIPRESRR